MNPRWPSPGRVSLRWKRLSLRWKLLLPFLALSLFTWIPAAQILGDSYQRTAEDQGREDARQMATSTARHLELKMAYLGQEAAVLATAGQLMMGDRSIKEAVSEVKDQGLGRFFVDDSGAGVSPDLVKVVDRRGREVVDLRKNVLEMMTRDLDDTNILAAARRGQSTGTVIGVKGGTAAYVAGVAPVVLRDRMIGSFIVGITLNREMLEELGVSNDFNLFVVGPDGVLASTGPSDGPGLQRVAVGPTSDEAVVDGKRYLMSSVPIDAPLTNGLRVAVAVPVAKLTAAARSGRLTAWSILGVGLIAFVGCGLWFSASLTRPVRAVTRAAEDLANGDLTARAPVTSNDEIGTLAAAFNTMGDELAQRAERLDDAFDELRRLSETDALTGLLNHRVVLERLQHEVDRAQRHELQLTVLVADVDNFKLINDTYGHPAGDDVIRQVAATISSEVRATDVVGRHGGDEFMVILPETGVGAAGVVADKLRRAMQHHPLPTPEGLSVPIRLSIGVASFPTDGTGMNELLAVADANLYSSKRLGGDTVTRSDEEDRPERVLAAGFGMFDAMVVAVDNKDRYTRRHSEEVTRMALAIAEGAGVSEETQRVLRVAGLLHDLGKIGVPDTVLRKPGSLTAEEYEIVKLHATLGATIIRGIPNEEAISQAVGAHHERWDGRGYPQGTAGQDIPLLGRILAIADAYSAMTSDRPYRQGLSVEEAILELRAGAGSQFDAQLVEVALRVCERGDPTGSRAHVAAGQAV